VKAHDPVRALVGSPGLDHLVVRLHRLLAAFAHEPPPTEEKVGRDAVLAAFPGLIFVSTAVPIMDS
jgi:hypothetical protein